jgi:hypothetical protein
MITVLDIVVQYTGQKVNLAELGYTSRDSPSKPFTLSPEP